MSASCNSLFCTTYFIVIGLYIFITIYVSHFVLLMSVSYLKLQYNPQSSSSFCVLHTKLYPRQSETLGGLPRGQFSVSPLWKSCDQPFTVTPQSKGRRVGAVESPLSWATGECFYRAHKKIQEGDSVLSQTAKENTLLA